MCDLAASRVGQFGGAATALADEEIAAADRLLLAPSRPSLWLLPLLICPGIRLALQRPSVRPSVLRVVRRRSNSGECVGRNRK